MNAHNFVAVINIAFITLNIKGTLQTEGESRLKLCYNPPCLICTNILA